MLIHRYSISSNNNTVIIRGILNRKRDNYTVIDFK